MVKEYYQFILKDTYWGLKPEIIHFKLNKELFNFGIVILIITISNHYIISQNLNTCPNNDFRITQWSEKEGLLNEGVRTMIQDTLGFLWLGTKMGISKFDGSTFKNYSKIRSGQSKGFNAIDASFGMIEDSLHNLWVSGDDNLYRYNLSLDSFQIVPPDTIVNKSIYIIPFWATKNEILCQEWSKDNSVSISKIVSYNVKSLIRKEIISIFDSDSIMPLFNMIRSAYFDEKLNQLWLIRGTKDVDNYKGSGLVSINLKTKERIIYNLNKNETFFNSNLFTASMIFDFKRKCFWINSDQGLIKFDQLSKKFSHVKTIPLQAINKEDLRLSSGIVMDKNNRIWFSTFYNGIVVYDPDLLCSISLKQNNSKLQNELGDRCVVLFCSRENIIYSGYTVAKGIYQILPNSNCVTYIEYSKYKFSKANVATINFKAGNNGIMWFGSSIGFGKINLSQDKINHYKYNDLAINTNERIKPWFSLTFVDYVDKTNNNIIFHIQPNGLYLFDESTGQCNLLKISDRFGKLVGNSRFDKTSYRDKILYLLYNTDRYFVAQIDPKNGKGEEIFSVNPITFVRNKYLFCFNEGICFIGGDGKEKNQTFKFKDNIWQRDSSFLDNIDWKYIIKDKKEGYWCLLENKIIKCNSKLSILESFNNLSGMPESPILSLTLDLSGNVWFNTETSIYRINIENKLVSKLAEHDGFQNYKMFESDNLELSSTGKIFVGEHSNKRGFLLIDPTIYQSTPSTIYIKNIEVNQSIVTIPNPIIKSNGVTINYKDYISIETSSIDYYSRGSNRVRYRLNQNDWQYGPSGYIIRYEKLPPGIYNLQIQSSNASNEFLGPIRSFKIKVSPPWWKTWWAYSFFSASFFWLIIGFIQFRSKSLRLRNQALELKVQSRTNDLYNSLDELKRTQNKLLIAERDKIEKELLRLKQEAAELEMQALRAQMNTHFIFNSLNSINHFILISDKHNASEYLLKFSKLIRMILDNSSYSMISIEKELEALRLYIELEALRFKGKFVYSINIQDDIDIGYFKVPPLILQPFVENSINHGLIPKQNESKLEIAVSLHHKFVVISIKDNGVGRYKVNEINQNHSEHKSLGMKLTKERINLLSRSDQIPEVEIIDLKNDIEALGTKVILKLPQLI